MNRATAAARLEDYGTAMLGYARAFDLDPGDRTPLHNLMAMFADMGKWVGALAIVDLSRQGQPPPDVAVALDLVSIQLLQLVAAAYPALGIDDDADRTVKDLLINASKRGARSQLAAARALCDIERFAEATKLIHNLARNPMLTKPERADLHYVEGLIAEHDGYASTAIDRYTRAVAADATRADAATNAISLLLTDGTPPALAQISMLIEQVDAEARASTPGLLFNQAIYQHRTGQGAAARDNLERVLSFEGGAPEILAAARQALTELGV
jgi:tetratricopeptide (TPR) repeat protein